jgi:hypothetical protein
MPRIELSYEPPSNGWLPLRLSVNGQTSEFHASDVPNNPICDLAVAIEKAAKGEPSFVWWHLEPDGYFMHFVPLGDKIEFRLEFSANSDRHKTRSVVSVQDQREKILIVFWRFLRNFQSHQYNEPHWPATDDSRMQTIKSLIARQNEA